MQTNVKNVTRTALHVKYWRLIVHNVDQIVIEIQYPIVNVKLNIMID